MLLGVWKSAFPWENVRIKFTNVTSFWYLGFPSMSTIPPTFLQKWSIQTYFESLSVSVAAKSSNPYAYHCSIAKKPTHADNFALPEELESSHKALKFKVGDRVRITNYRNIFSKRLHWKMVITNICGWNNSCWEIIIGHIESRFIRRKKGSFYKK